MSFEATDGRTPTEREPERQSLLLDVAAFIKGGGQVQRVARGVSGEVGTRTFIINPRTVPPRETQVKPRTVQKRGRGRPRKRSDTTVDQERRESLQRRKDALWKLLKPHLSADSEMSCDELLTAVGIEITIGNRNRLGAAISKRPGVVKRVTNPRGKGTVTRYRLRD